VQNCTAGSIYRDRRTNGLKSTIRASRYRGIVMALLLVAIVIVAFHEEIKRLAGW
jgi:hypothetical protein